MSVAANQIFQVRSLHDHSLTDDLIRESRAWSTDFPVTLDFGSLRTTYPNGTVPFAATLNFLRGSGFRFHSIGMHPDQDRIRVPEPLTVDQFVRGETPLTNCVWEYRDEREAQWLADKFMEALTHQVHCEAGVIDTLNWCLYEVLDNVFQHSQVYSGFVMMQLHRQNRKCVVAVTDTGRGIQRSLLEASAESRVDRALLAMAHLAIDHAMQEGVTSKGKLNQGNGLHGLRRSIEINGGSLAVRSGRGSWRYEDGFVESNTDLNRPVLDATSVHGTTVDWQLDCATPVSINDALGRSERQSEMLETILGDEGYYRIDAAEIEDSIGSRVHGAEVRTRIANYVAQGAAQIVIDFSGLSIVSSSFADEVLGKLAVELGELEFRRRIFVENASRANLGLIQRAIELRVSSGL